jgi:DNA-binding CsgD family transcriptional regulator
MYQSLLYFGCVKLPVSGGDRVDCGGEFGMERLRGRDIRLLLAALVELTSLDLLDSFPERALSVVDRLIPADNSAYNEVDIERQRAFVVTSPKEVLVDGDDQVFAEHALDNPLVSHIQQTGDGSPAKFSDFMSARQLHELPLYRLVYRRMGVEHQLAFALTGSPIIGINFNRDVCDFSDRERLMLDVLRPFLRQAYRTSAAFARLAGALDSSGRATILLDDDGGPLLVTEHGRGLLQQYFGQAGAGPSLPEPLQGWVEQHRAYRATDHDEPRLPMPLVIPRGERRLRVHFVRAGAQRHADAVLLEEEDDPRGAAARLSPREREVLQQAAIGLSDAEIAGALNLSRRTVQGHLQRIYGKLGVTNRTAAVAHAVRPLS